jgi:hypothetical protein
VTALLAAAVAAAAVTAPLAPVARSGVAGTAVVTQAFSGTNIVLSLRGLAPRASIRALLDAGTCARPGASVAPIVEARATRAGALRVTGRAFFRSRPVAYETVADGGHVIRIVAGGRTVACGAVPMA